MMNAKPTITERSGTGQGANANAPRRGAVLIAVLIVVVLLSLAAYQYAAMMTSEYKASDQAVRIAQARAAGESAIHYVAAMLADPNNMENLLSGNPYDNPAVFHDIVVAPNEVSRFVAKFSVITPRFDDPDGVMGTQYGVIGEGSKINLNALMKLDPKGTALYNMLLKLPNMTQDIANSIVFWLDPAATPRTSADGGMGSADNSVYSGKAPAAYLAKNGDIQSIEELLYVEGVTPALLFGNDLNRNGIQDPDELTSDGVFDRGWAAHFTIYSRELNKDSTGAARVNVNDADLLTLETSLSEAVGEELTTFILLFRNYGAVAATTTTTIGTTSTDGSGGVVLQVTQSTTATTSTAVAGDLSQVDRSLLTSGKGSKKITSLYDLIDAKVEMPSTDPNGKATSYTSPLSSAEMETLHELFPMLFEKATLNADLEIVGRININTASETVMRTLPELTEEQVDLILSIRPDHTTSDASDPVFKTPAWLMTEASIPAATMKKLDKYITTTEQVYSFQTLGYFEGGGPTARYEAVVDTNGGMPRILFHREISGDLGRGFDTKIDK